MDNNLPRHNLVFCIPFAGDILKQKKHLNFTIRMFFSPQSALQLGAKKLKLYRKVYQQSGESRYSNLLNDGEPSQISR